MMEPLEVLSELNKFLRWVKIHHDATPNLWHAEMQRLGPRSDKCEFCEWSYTMEIRDLGTPPVIRPEDVPAEILSIVDEAAGRLHNPIDGSVIKTIAAVLTKWEELKLAPRYKMPMSGDTSYGRVGPDDKQ